MKNTMMIRCIIIACLILVLASAQILAANAAPVNTSLTPSTGVLVSDVKSRFTSVYSDANGYANLAQCYLLLNNTYSGTNGIYLRYDANTNKLYLRNDASSSWGTGYAPGSARAVANSQCTLYCSETTVSRSGNSLTVNWKITLKPVMAGKALSGWMTVYDDSGLTTTAQRGSFKVNRTPTSTSLVPNSGLVAADGTAKTTITSVYSDADGCANLAQCYLLMNTTLTGANAIYLRYDCNTNKLYLRNDSHTAWGTGYSPGATNVLQNSSVKLSCKETKVVASGNNVTITWNITLKSRMAGKTLPAWMWASDDSICTAPYVQKGTLVGDLAPTNTSLTPSSGALATNSKATLATRFSDANGYANLAQCYLLLNTTYSGANGIYLRYDANANKLYLRNDASSSWGTGYAPGSANTVANSQCTLYCGETTVSKSGNSLTVNWKVTLKPAMAGKALSAWMTVYDDPGASATSMQGSFTTPVQRLVNQVEVTPESITMFKGNTYNVLRAHALDSSSKVMTGSTSFTWQSDNTSVVTVTDQGMSKDGQYRLAKLTAVNPGQTYVRSTAGGVSNWIQVTVINNPTLMADKYLSVPANSSTGVQNIPVFQNGYRYLYFNCEPGLKYRLVVEKIEGHLDVDVASSTSFTSSTILNSGDTYSGEYAVNIVAGQKYGACFVRVKGTSASNYFNCRLYADYSAYSAFTYPPPYSMDTAYANGPISYATMGDEDYQYYALPVKKDMTYWIEVKDFGGHMDVWVANDASFKSIIRSGDTYWGEYTAKITADADGMKYISLRGTGLSNYYRLRIFTPDSAASVYQVHATAKQIILPTGSSTTVYADALDTLNNITTSTSSFSWAVDNTSLATVTPGPLTPDGYFRTATVTAAAGVQYFDYATVRVTSHGMTDKVVVRAVNMQNLWGMNYPLSTSGQVTTHTVADNASKVYWFQVRPGKEYNLRVVALDGHEDIKVYGNPLLYDEIYSGDTYRGEYERRFIAPTFYGTYFVQVTGANTANQYSVSVSEVAPADADERYFPRNTIIPITVNAVSIKARLADDAANDLPDTYSFVTDEQYTEYTVSVERSSGHMDVVVADDPLGEDVVRSGDTYSGTWTYRFQGIDPGRKYYVIVSGADAYNHYAISVTKK